MHTRYTAHTAGVLHVYMAQLPTCGGACGSCTGSLVAVYVASAPVAAAQAQHGSTGHKHKHTAGTRHQVPQATRWRSLPVLMRRTGYRSNATGAWPQSPAGLLCWDTMLVPTLLVALCWCLL